MWTLFNLFIIDPMINSLALLYIVFFDKFWLAIIVFTIIVRLATLPLTLRQTRQMKTMSGLQPRVKEIQERYKNDRSRVSQETMKLYREAGVNPLGCLGPMVIQLPIWIGLFQALRKTLPANPDSLIGLSQRFYGWLPFVDGTVPLDTRFLWMNLANPDPSPLIMPVLVGVTTWAQQKMTTTPAMDEKQASTNRMMLWMMPLMLGFFTLSFPSGLALYWITSNIIGIGIQYRTLGGWGPLFAKSTPAPATVPARSSEAGRRRRAKAMEEEMGVQEVSARTAEEAIEVARRELDASREEVEVEIISRGKGGFLGIGSEPARVRVKRLPPGAGLGPAAAAIEIVNKLLLAARTETMANLRSAHDPKTGGPIVDILGEDSGLLIGRRGETLRALQFLVNLMVRNRFGEESTRVFLDVERYRERRYTSLENMAKRVAEKVSATGRAVSLEPMSPSERRIIHMALAEHPRVETHSDGLGEDRRVTVAPRQRSTSTTAPEASDPSSESDEVE